MTPCEEIRSFHDQLAELEKQLAESQAHLQRAMAVVTAAVHLCNHDATHHRHVFHFSLDQALIDNGFKEKP